MMKYKYIILLCSFSLTSFADSNIEQQEWINLKPTKEIKAVDSLPQADTQKLDELNSTQNITPEIDYLSELVLKKNELLSQSVDDWAKYNGIDFI